MIDNFARDIALKKAMQSKNLLKCGVLLFTDVFVYFKFGSMMKRIDVIYKGILALHK
jgi:hypothetical protein